MSSCKWRRTATSTPLCGASSFQLRLLLVVTEDKAGNGLECHSSICWHMTSRSKCYSLSTLRLRKNHDQNRLLLTDWHFLWYSTHDDLLRVSLRSAAKGGDNDLQHDPCGGFQVKRTMIGKYARTPPLFVEGSSLLISSSSLFTLATTTLTCSRLLLD